MSIINREGGDRINTDRTYTSAPTMAAIVSPASIYSNGPPPPYSNWSAPPPPPESRRISDNKVDGPPPLQTIPPHRQSLPSIHEALNTKPYASPVSASLPPAHNPTPYPQGPSIPRTYPPSDHAPYQTNTSVSHSRQSPPPHLIHPQQTSSYAHEPPPNSFQEPPRHTVANVPAAPAPHAQYGAPRYEPPRYEPEGRLPERNTNGYSHHAHHSHPPQTGSYNYPPAPDQMSRPPEPSYNAPL
jgi:hypothetical protein